MYMLGHEIEAFIAVTLMSPLTDRDTTSTSMLVCCIPIPYIGG